MPILLQLGKLHEEMEKLKETLDAVRSFPVRLRRLLRTVYRSEATRGMAMSLTTLVLSFLLSGASIAGRAMPFAVCLTAAAAAPLRSLAAMLGAVLGYLYFWGFPMGLEFMAAAVLVFAAVCIAGEGQLKTTAWFLPALTTALTAMVGVLFLLQARFAPQAVLVYILRLILAAALTAVFSRALSQRSDAALLLAGCCLLSGCASVELAVGVTLGQILAVAAAAAAAGTTNGLLLATAAGLSVDLAVVPPVSLTALLCCAALAVRLLPFRLRAAQIVAFLTVVVAGVLFTGGQMPELVPAAALGCCGAVLLPRDLFLGMEERMVGDVAHRLETAAAVFDEIGKTLDAGGDAPQGEVTVIFDRASDRVCGNCVLWSQCWQQRSTETYHALCAVARPMLERGAVVREDFPHGFADKCCRLDNLIAAINREVDNVTYHRQCERRLRESRTILARQYGFLRDYLLQTAALEDEDDEADVCYWPDLGIAAAGKEGNKLSGDRGACFRTPDGCYCLLLCDGMGTGEDAAAESAAAIRTVAGLIRAGVAPAAALETLNGAYILRGDGCFATVDLLSVSLVTGEGTLYKWGAAPSYLKTGSGVQKIGTAAPPPGLGVGEGHKAAEYQLSLRDGEMLVLLSDGAGGEDAGRQIAAWEDGGPKSLAAALVAGAPAGGEDDRTALALCLRPCSVRT